MTDTQADLTARARAILDDPRFPGLITPVPMDRTGTFTVRATFGDGGRQAAIELIATALQSERSAERAEARRAAIEEMIAECDRIRASYPTELNGAYRPANAQAGWNEACLRLRATCIALALPAPQEETR